VVIDAHNTLITGHARVEAAKEAGLTEIPVVLASHLTEAQKRTFRIADNKLAELSEWDPEVLRLELTDLLAVDLDFSVELTGFSTPELDVIVEGESAEVEPKDEVLPAVRDAAITRPGDLWRLGSHLLLCADARDAAAYERLLGPNKARVIVSDPPYNVKIDGHVSGLGRVRHREFSMASGEMSSEEFTHFLAVVFKLLAARGVDGALYYLFMDHRHLLEMAIAGQRVYDERLNLLIWIKPNGGMGSFYRSQHELIFVYKKGNAPHVNNVQLGVHGRYRTNVLQYAGANSFSATRNEDLARHPTPKPVALIADLLRDASNLGDWVLDCFAGGGTILIAAEKTKRRAAAIEIDPIYCDLSIERWQAFTGKAAVLADTGQTFAEVAAERREKSTGEPEAALGVGHVEH
jgi:DNA modification methylase